MTENTTNIKVSPNQPIELEPLFSLNPARLQELSGLREHQSLDGTMLFRESDIDNKSIDRLYKAFQNIRYCKNGKRSSAAAYLLNERGFKAHALRGDLQVLPDDKQLEEPWSSSNP